MIIGVVVTERLQALLLRCGFLSSSCQSSFGVVAAFA
jgi:hypothetical protein